MSLSKSDLEMLAAVVAASVQAAVPQGKRAREYKSAAVKAAENAHASVHPTGTPKAGGGTYSVSTIKLKHGERVLASIGTRDMTYAEVESVLVNALAAWREAKS